MQEKEADNLHKVIELPSDKIVRGVSYIDWDRLLVVITHLDVQLFTLPHL